MRIMLEIQYHLNQSMTRYLQRKKIQFLLPQKQIEFPIFNYVTTQPKMQHNDPELYLKKWLTKVEDQ